MPEIEYQRPGRNKFTQIDKSFIESGSYRRKFDKITKSPQINRLLYQLAKNMLYHRAGTVFEDMYWIDAESCKIVAQETENDFEEEIRYSETTRKAIRNSSHLITIHSHPGSYPPSLSDLNSNYEHRYILGVIACHDGSVYIYSSEEWISEYYYNVTVAGYLEKGYKAGDLLNFVRNIRIDFRR